MSQFIPPPPDSPGLPPPPGVTPDFFSPFTLEPYNILSVAGCTIITTTMVFLRLYTKKFVIKRMSWEDYFCILGWAAMIAYLGISVTIGTHGGGTHQWNLHYEDVQYNLRFVNYSDMLYSVSLLATKLSIMLLIKRVFCSVQKNIPYYLTWSLIYVNTGFYICYIVVPAVECSPRSKIWTPTAPGKCVQVKALVRPPNRLRDHHIVEKKHTDSRTNTF